MTRHLTRGALAVAAGALLALALAATPLRADLGGASPDSWPRFFRYAGCALGIAGAASGFGVAAAVAMCLHVLVTEG
jgi:hypothetical protein